MSAHCTHENCVIEHGVTVPIKRGSYGYFVVAGPIQIKTEWRRCSDCNALISVETDDLDLGDDFEVS